MKMPVNITSYYIVVFVAIVDAVVIVIIVGANVVSVVITNEISNKEKETERDR